MGGWCFDILWVFDPDMPGFYSSSSRYWWWRDVQLTALYLVLPATRSRKEG